MKKLTILLIALGACVSQLAVINTAFADESSKAQQIEDKFKAADQNNDGQLTLEEAKADMPRVAKAFAKIDKDNKGYVTVELIKAMSGN